MNQVYEKLLKCVESVRKQVDFVPRIGLVLGSGLGALADEIQVEATLSYQDIEGFPISTVKGHKGRLVFGYIESVPVVIMQGRVHYYEGYKMEDVVLPIRLIKLLGAEILFLTNAAGGISPQFRPGDLMLIKDHISSYVPSPLVGENIEELGTRFPDMSEVYDLELQKMIEETCLKADVALQKGVYLQTTGPAYETPSEIRAFRTLGADAVGMSTACEATAAVHMQMKVCGISCISNMAAGMTGNPLSHVEVQEAADQAAPKFKKIVTEAIVAMGGKYV